MKSRHHKTDVRDVARRRAEGLIMLAQAMWPQDQTLAKRYVKLARQLAMRHRVHLDPRKFCKACGVPFTADTLKVRQDRKTQTVLYACRKCNTLRRIPYKGKPKAPRKAGLNRQPGSTKTDARKKDSKKQRVIP